MPFYCMAECESAFEHLRTCLITTPVAVVWGVAHFRYYLYGHKVNIYTDHAAVKTILGTPNLTGKHACWWSKLYGSDISEIDIVH